MRYQSKCPCCKSLNYFNSSFPGNPGSTCLHYSHMDGADMIFVDGGKQINVRTDEIDKYQDSVD